MYTLGRETLEGDFGQVKKTHLSLWKKVEDAVKTAAKNQKAAQSASKKVVNYWKSNGEYFLGINRAQGWTKAAGRLATACQVYDTAMKFVVCAIWQRLQDVKRGKSLSLDPGLGDLLEAIKLFKKEPDVAAISDEDLSSMGIRRNKMGLLEEDDDNLSIEPMEAGAAASFELPSSKGLRALPSAIIEELSDVASDSENEDEPTATTNPADPAVTRTQPPAEDGVYPPPPKATHPGVTIGSQALGKTITEISNTPAAASGPASNRAGASGPGGTPGPESNQAGASGPNSGLLGDPATKKGKSNVSSGTPGGTSGPSKWQRQRKRAPASTKDQKGKGKATAGESTQSGTASKNRSSHSESGIHNETNKTNKEELSKENARKIMILDDLFKRLSIRNTSAKEVLEEGVLRTQTNIFQWWYGTLGEKKHKVLLADCALEELERFKHYHGAEFDSYQYSLFQQLAECDPVLWLLQAILSSKRELYAFPQGVQQKDVTNDSSDKNVIARYGVATTVLCIPANRSHDKGMHMCPSLLTADNLEQIAQGSVAAGEAPAALSALRSKQHPITIKLTGGESNAKALEEFQVLTGISPLSEAIMGRRAYSEWEVQEEMDLLLGEDRDAAWGWIQEWRTAAAASIRLKFALLVRMEGNKFGKGKFDGAE
ncbi:uncharacterized protein BJX67DRAFT_344391 [Aspergillus lucknowensis]|uniref:Uncharacterized protein n=1 Tax=Aspergillus lucknowensis TaxID=176173 RepID=A0ABR4M1K3_9EURO